MYKAVFCLCTTMLLYTRAVYSEETTELQFPAIILLIIMHLNFKAPIITHKEYFIIVQSDFVKCIFVNKIFSSIRVANQTNSLYFKKGTQGKIGKLYGNIKIVFDNE